MEHALINWIQIPCENLERAAKFYSQTLEVDFFFETLNDIPHAVFKENAKGQRPVNGALIEVKDQSRLGQGTILFFEATGRFEYILEKVKENGGQVLIPKTLIRKNLGGGSSAIPNTYIDNKPGYFAHFIDSEGNRMGLYGTN